MNLASVTDQQQNHRGEETIENQSDDELSKQNQDEAQLSEVELQAGVYKILR